MEHVFKNYMKVFIDGTLKEDKIGYTVITPESTITERMRLQTTIFNAEQEVVIKAIYFAKTKKKPTLIATDSLSPTKGSQTTQNPKNRRRQTNGSFKLIWIHSHSKIMENESAARKSL
jgi:hypothetical protein